LLNDRAKLSEEQMQKYLQQIYDSNSHLVLMVDALLNVSRIDLGTLSFKPEPVDMGELLKEVLKELTVVAAAKKIVMSVHISPHLLPVMIDRNALQIVFQNLLSNAIKYSKEGGEIITWLKQRSGNGEIIVSDSGIGIPETEQNRIYSKMFRASNAAETAIDGTGLGLYITKAMIERAKGQITFESTEGEGTTFYVIIPSKVD
jgi:signal transduction histidine kinase